MREKYVLKGISMWVWFYLRDEKEEMKFIFMEHLLDARPGHVADPGALPF